MADVVIAEVNPNMPTCLGGNEESVHISRVHHIVEAPADQKLFDASEAAPTAVDEQIAQHIMKHIHDGCCIQLGIGGMPNPVGKPIADSDLKNLGGHTEMFVDAYVDMMESGRMNGAERRTDRYGAPIRLPWVRRMYDFMHNNPALASYRWITPTIPVSSRRSTTGSSINNAIQVDLYTQVNSESVGTNQISGNGGMWDFVLGAQWSRRGKSFICLMSTYPDSTGKLHSRIMPQLPPGSIITIPRQMVDYIVTEYGAPIGRCPTWQRAEIIIGIAHPDFRDDLSRRRKKWIYGAGPTKESGTP